MRIFLIGFMGSGKSHWGKIWAAATNMTWYDIDTIIEEDEQLSIEQIFEKKGVQYFRQKEAAILRSMVDYNNCIISCGGGTACYENNMNWMLANGKTVYLKADAEWLLNNMINELDKRPLFKNMDQHELINFINTMLTERNPFYHQASLVFDAEQLNPSSIYQILQYTEDTYA